MPMREERKTASFVLEVRPAVTIALALTAVLFFLPLLFLSGTPLTPQGGTEAPEEEATLPIDRAVTTSAARDKGRAVRLKTDDGQVVEMTMADYLWGVVAAEMPASFEEGP